MNVQPELIELIESWETLRFNIKKNKKVDLETFGTTFTKTYSLLSQYSAEEKIDKKYMSLISSAILFANADSKELNSKCRAALALTERMINCCVFSTSSAPCEGTTIYVFEIRRDIYVNFNNINESINKLEVLFENDYWRSI